jgi:tetratricopeptide (TPR) repeat protein
MTRPNIPRQRPRTEFRVPPPLVRRINGLHLSGFSLLDDEIGSARLVFWEAFRDAELWATSPDRDGLFRPDCVESRNRGVADLDPDMYGPAKPYLGVLIELIGNPSGTSPEAVRDACAHLGKWFEDRGLLRCAVEFNLAAYFVQPDQATLAVRVARLLRMLCEYPRSTSWFDYAIYLARRRNDWLAYTEALTGLGILHHQRGNFPRARQYHRRCVRVASRNRLREMIGAAYHNLFILEVDAGDAELGESYALKAFSGYGPKSPRVVRLARDLAQRWTLAGEFARSLPLGLEALNHFSVPLDLAQVWAGVGHAAGGLGDWPVFEDAWVETWAIVRQGRADPVASKVLLDLARGAALLRDERRAVHAATKALEIAQERQEGHTIFEAETFLAALQADVVNSVAPEGIQHTPTTLDQSVLDALRTLRAVTA